MIMDDRLTDVLETMIKDAQKNGDTSMAHNLLSVRMRMSHVNRCSFLPSIAVTIAQLENELALGQMMIWADEESFEFGFANLMEACTQFTDIALHDAENGKKAHALKLVSVSKSYELPMFKKGEKR